MDRKKAIWVISTVLLITVFFVIQLPDLKFNYVFEDFFPTDDPELEYYQQFKADFGEDNDYLLIAVTNRGSIFDAGFLEKVNTLSTNLEALEGSQNIRSLLNTSQSVIGPLGTFNIPLIHWQEPEKYTRDSVRLFSSSQYIKRLITADATSLLIFAKHNHFTSEDEIFTYLNQVQELTSDFNPNDLNIAGKLIAQQTFIAKMQQELMIFLSASFLLIVIFLFLAYRTFWLVVLPLLVVMFGAIWILGIIAISGKPIDILMVLLPTIMFVVGMSDVVHILTKYLEQLRLNHTKLAAIQVTFKEIGLATFLTSLTTAIGFFTLLTASIQPIRQFGIFTGIGVFLAFIVAFSLIPASLFLMNKPKVALQLEHKSIWVYWLSKSFQFVTNQRLLILGLNGLLIIIAVFGIQQININTFLIEDLPDNDPLKQSFIFFDKNFGGSRPFEMTVSSFDSTIFDSEVLHEIEKVESYLAEQYEVSNIISPTYFINNLNQAINGGRPESFKLPETESQWSKISKYLPAIARSKETSPYIANDVRMARISGLIKDEGSAITLEKTARLRAFLRENTDSTKTTFTVTGTSNLIDKNNLYLAKNMFFGLAIAFGVVALIAGALFQSVRMVIITLIPNIIPLLLVAGIMGMFGITLKLSTSIVFTIAFGIAVDDTIHFISKLKLELNKGKSVLYALKRTYLSTGKALIVTSIILSGGFLILLLSSFGGTFYTGLLISLTLIFALIVDLTLLPVLILLFYRNSVARKR